MKKKLFLLTFSAVFLLVFSVFQVSAATFSPALNVIANKAELKINGICGNDILFSKKFFKELLSCRILNKIQITGLPDEDKGVFTINGNKIECGEVISARELDNLVFSPITSDSFDTDFSFDVFSPGIRYNATCSIHIIDKLNFSPVIIQATSVSTFEGVSCFSSLTAIDPENDALTFEITEFPKKGTIDLKSKTKGEYCYTPYKNSHGDDCFYYIAVDKYGNKSTPAKVTVNIDKLDNGVIYSDMQKSPYGYAATLLSKQSILTGENLNGEYLFHPNKEITKAEFLTYTMLCAKIPLCQTEKNNHNSNLESIVDFDTINNEQIKNYVSLGYDLGYLDGIINEGGTIEINSPITFAEGAAIINKICCYNTTEEHFVFSPAENIPTWARLAVSTLQANCPTVDIPESIMKNSITREQFAKLMTDTILKTAIDF